MYMALQSSGAISVNNINVELEKAGTTQASLGQTDFRSLSGILSGAISFASFYGKALWAYGNTQLATTATHSSGWNELRWIESINYFPAPRRQISYSGYAYVWDSSESHEYIYFRRVSDGAWILKNQIDTGYYGGGASGWWDMSGTTEADVPYDAIKVVTYSKNFSHYTECSANITSYYQKG